VRRRGNGFYRGNCRKIRFSAQKILPSEGVFPAR
jgi:hypothetical protein